MSDDIQGLRERLAKQGEEALGKFAQELLENPLVTGALTRAFEARERAVQAQEVAMGALNIPSAADVERLTRRLRSVAQRLEGIEDALDRLDRRSEATPAGSGDGERLASIERQLTELNERIGRLAGDLGAGAPAPVSASDAPSAAKADDPAKGESRQPARKTATTAAKRTTQTRRKPPAKSS